MDNREQRGESSFDAGERERQFGTGELATVSGIYQVLQHPHFSEGELFVRQGNMLPSCPICGEPAKFRLVKKIVHIDEDPDFR